MNRKIKYIIIIWVAGFFSCKNDNDIIIPDDSLFNLVTKNIVKVDNVIACASSSDMEDAIIAYLYPRPGATDIRYFETTTINDDKNDYLKYKQVSLETQDFFGGHIKAFTRTTSQEKWVIITFFENNELHLSNPIRLKHRTKPTEFSDKTTIQNSVMPIFNWEDGIYDDNKIYFQVVSQENNDFLSGTYTFQKQFQFYKLDNVVLNVTEQTPPQLTPGNMYNFTLMGVSEDNWVNLLIRKNFTP